MRTLIAIAALLASVSAGAVFADTTPPELVSWSLDRRQVDVTLAPATVTFSFELTDSESVCCSFEVVAAYVPINPYSGPTNYFPGYGFLVADELGSSGPSDGSSWERIYKFVIPERGYPGTYTLYFRNLKDQAGNQAGKLYTEGWNDVFLYPPLNESPITFEVVRGPDPIVQLTVEEPVANETHMGVGNIRGWAVASRGVERVSAFLNNTFLAEIPYGGTRGDVASAFPEVSGSASSGFAMSFNYSNLCEGTHTLAIHVRTTEGETHVSEVEFQTIGLDREFINSSEIVDLDTSALTATGEEIEVRNISIAGKYYNALLRWRTAEQGFEIVELEPLDSAMRSCNASPTF